MSKKGELQVDTYKEYKDLLSKTYDKAVDCLLQKYGPAQDDYFREKSYQRFMAGEIKNITKGKFSRTDEGLYCHHIDEKKYLNIPNQLFVKMNKISFDYYEAKKKAIEEFKALKDARETEDIKQAEKNKEREKQIQKNRNEKFYYTYPEFNSMGIRFDTPRRKVIAMLYDYKYKDTYKSKKELDLAKKPIIKNELLQELYLVIYNADHNK